MHIGHRVAQCPRHGLVFKHQVHHCARGLGVGVQGIIHAAMARHLLELDVGIGIVALGNLTHDALDAMFHAVDVNVADDDHRLPLRAVPAMIKREQLSASDVADNGHVADGDAVGIAAARQQDWQCVLIHAHRLVGMHAPLLLNHAALLLDGTVVEAEFTGQVLQHQQHGVEQGGAFGRDVGYLEARVVKSRRGVDVAAVRHPVVLQDVHHIDARKVACALEGDVLDEVCQAPLIVLLDQRAGVLHQPELGASLGLLVVTDVIGQPVLQPPNPQFRVYRQLLLPSFRHLHQDKQGKCHYPSTYPFVHSSIPF